MENWGNLIKECTRSLHDDPELELDVAAELRGHLEDKFAELTDGGMTDAEAQTAAMKAFGEPEDIAASLQEANFRRMKLRSRFCLILKLAVIPMALLALWFAVDFRLLRTLEPLRILMKMSDNQRYSQQFLDISPAGMPEETDIFCALPKLTEDEELIVGVANAERNLPLMLNNAEKLREKFPAEPVFQANYINELLNSSQPATVIIPELYKAMKAEPENAYYNYILASIYLDAATDKKYIGANPGFKWGPQGRWGKNWKAEIKDHQKFNLGIAAIKQGWGKSYCRDYIPEMTLRRINILCDHHDFFDAVNSWSLAASTLIPYLMRYNDIASVLPLYLDSLPKEGAADEVMAWINGCKHMEMQLLQENNNLICLTAGTKRLSYYLEVFPPILVQNGKILEAEKLRRQLGAAIEPVSKWQKQYSTKVTSQGGFLASCTVPESDIDVERFVPERNLEYCIWEKLCLAAMSLPVMLIIGFCAIVSFGFFLARQRGFLLLPRGREGIKIFFYGLVLPLLIYLLATRIEFLSGRDDNIIVNGWRLIPQSAYLIIGLPAIFLFVCCRWLHRRCGELGLQSRKKRFAVYAASLIPMLAVFMMVISVGLRSALDYLEKRYLSEDTVIFTTGVNRVSLDGVTKKLNAEVIKGLE